MELAVPESDRTGRPAAGFEHPGKLKILVVDDEPDNLDLLYRTFRRDFQVLRAESGVAALKMLEQEGEVAVIISDQRMPEMKGTEFLSRTVPQFPNTMRIILTGFTDIEDLVDAINAGQVYRYITKPWDPGELRTVVQRAAETYELCRQRTEELQRAQAQTMLFVAIAQATLHKHLETLLPPVTRAFSEAFNADGCVLYPLPTDTQPDPPVGYFGSCTLTLSDLGDDPLVQEAIATLTLQSCVDRAADPRLAPMASGHTCRAYAAVPIAFREKAIAVLVLQWQPPRSFNDEERRWLTLSAQQAALAIACCTT